MLHQVDRKDSIIIVKNSHSRTGATLGFQLHHVLSLPVVIGKTTRMFDRANTLRDARDLLDRDPNSYFWHKGA